jgi:DNA-binding transcriptional MerR regulator
MTITETAGVAISDAAELTGVSTHTLRYYERTGLMFTPVDRASSTHRRYTEADITWIVFLTKLRSTAMPIARVRQYVELARAGADTTGARLALLLEHRTSVVAQLDEMTNSLAAIDFKIATYREGALGT